MIDADDSDGTATPLARLLPTLKVDATDPAANLILAAAAITRPDKRLTTLRDIATRKPDLVEGKLRLADALISVDGNMAPGQVSSQIPGQVFSLLNAVEEKIRSIGACIGIAARPCSLAPKQPRRDPRSIGPILSFPEKLPPTSRLPSRLKPRAT